MGHRVEEHPKIMSFIETVIKKPLEGISEAASQEGLLYALNRFEQFDPDRGISAYQYFRSCYFAKAKHYTERDMHCVQLPEYLDPTVCAADDTYRKDEPSYTIEHELDKPIDPDSRTAAEELLALYAVYSENIFNIRPVEITDAT